MRILYVDLEREWRGGQSQALFTLRGLGERRLQVELVAARDSPLAIRSRAAGMAVHDVARFGLRAQAAAAVRKLLSKDSFDLVHLNEPHALTAAWLADAHKKLPLLLSRRIGFPLGDGWVSRRRYAAVERFLANSRNVAQSLIDCGIVPERISIVNEGVEIPPLPSTERRRSARSQWGVKDQEFLFGSIGVFVPEKGQRHLIEALREVRKSHPEARLLLAGDGRCRGALQALAKRLEQSEAVLFPGFVTDVAKVYDALDAFTFPSEFEGLGTALQGAMAAGLPSVSTKRGALGEVVDHERTALVAEPNGQEFAAAMLRVMTDADLRKRLGGSGRREVRERFSAERMVEHTVRVYEDVLRKWRGT
jgi:glycosyltransferase involved in cell wall biosynthesis